VIVGPGIVPDRLPLARSLGGGELRASAGDPGVHDRDRDAPAPTIPPRLRGPDQVQDIIERGGARIVRPDHVEVERTAVIELKPEVLDDPSLVRPFEEAEVLVEVTLRFDTPLRPRRQLNGHEQPARMPHWHPRRGGLDRLRRLERLRALKENLVSTCHRHFPRCLHPVSASASIASDRTPVRGRTAAISTRTSLMRIWHHEG